MKTILVVDVPDDFDAKTAIAIVDIKNEKGEGVTAMCPVKPMPSKKVPVFDANSASYDEEYEKRIMYEINGYNRCVDEIMGGTE